MEKPDLTKLPTTYADLQTALAWCEGYEVGRRECSNGSCLEKVREWHDRLKQEQDSLRQRVAAITDEADKARIWERALRCQAERGNK